jgi:hypothetical protein
VVYGYMYVSTTYNVQRTSYIIDHPSLRDKEDARADIELRFYMSARQCLSAAQPSPPFGP